MLIMGNKPWVILGDFNAMLFPHDGFGSISRRNLDMLAFEKCVEDIEVYDAQYTGIQYTWCPKPSDESGIRRNLDRILVNNKFTEKITDASARFHPRGLSDHSPAVLSFTGGTRRVVTGFKFDNFLVNDPAFLRIVEE